MHQFTTTPGRAVIENGKEYLFFSGYGYLGMQQVPEFVALVKEGIDRYGWMFPSSRISNTRLELFAECEELLSSITGAEDTVLTSSGFLAGRLAVSKWKKKIHNLKPSHPAIQVGEGSQHPSGIFAIDSVDTLHAAISDFSFATKEPQQKTIIIDDSHGFGLIGNNGQGIASFLPYDAHNEYVLTYSLSKAPSISAGAVSCSKTIADELRTFPEYAACTAPSPALLYAFINGQHLYEQQRMLLQNNMQYFQQLIQGIDSITYHPLLPVFVLPHDIDLQILNEKNIILSSFAYPDPSGNKINRVVLNALHTRNDLDYLAESLRTIITR